MLLTLLLAAQAAQAAKPPPARLVVPEELKKEREAESKPPAPVLGDAALSEALGPLKPEVGAWVEYAVRTRGTPDARVRIAVLPPALENGWYWLEEVSLGNEGAASAVKMRLHGDPSDTRNIDRMYLFVPGQAPIEVPLDQIPKAGPPAHKPGKAVRGAPERIKVMAGTFEKAETLRSGNLRIWRAQSVPLWGLVKATSPGQTVELMNSGRTGAHSAFPAGFADDQNQGKGSEIAK